MLHVIQLEYPPDEISIYLVDADPSVSATEAIKRACEKHSILNNAPIQRITCTHIMLPVGVPTLIY